MQSSSVCSGSFTFRTKNTAMRGKGVRRWPSEEQSEEKPVSRWGGWASRVEKGREMCEAALCEVGGHRSQFHGPLVGLNVIMYVSTSCQLVNVLKMLGITIENEDLPPRWCFRGVLCSPQRWSRTKSSNHFCSDARGSFQGRRLWLISSSNLESNGWRAGVLVVVCDLFNHGVYCSSVAFFLIASVSGFQSHSSHIKIIQFPKLTGKVTGGSFTVTQYNHVT